MAPKIPTAPNIMLIKQKVFDSSFFKPKIPSVKAAAAKSPVNKPMNNGNPR